MDTMKMELNENNMENVTGGRAINTDTGYYIWYNVLPGDNLSKIGKHYNCTWQIIYQLNKSVIGNDPNLIKPGISLKIPQ